MTFVMLYVTYPDMKVAKIIGNLLLEKKLVACVNYFPIECSYLWKGSIDGGNEIVSILKTDSSFFPKIEMVIRENHPYEVPCILQLVSSANSDYEKWIKSELFD